MIYPLLGDDLGVFRNENYALFEWNKHGRVVFSATRNGEAISIHFAANKKALRYLKIALEEYFKWIFDTCEWCTMILGTIRKQSVCRLVEKIGCVFIAETVSDAKVYMRLRNG